MEYLDLYNEKKEKTGETILRGNEIPEGRYIKIVIVYIENSKGEFLYQMTSKEKGNIWATTGGHVTAGDDGFKTVVKEVDEELGYKVNPDKLKHIFTGMKSSRILEVYYLKEDIDIDSLKLQKEEVDYVKWLSKSELKDLLNKENIRRSNIEIMMECGLLDE